MLSQVHDQVVLTMVLTNSSLEWLLEAVRRITSFCDYQHLLAPSVAPRCWVAQKCRRTL